MYIYYIDIPLHADSVSTEITFSCMIIVIIMTLMVAGYYFIHKHDTIKKRCIRGVFMILTVSSRMLKVTGINLLTGTTF